MKKQLRNVFALLLGAVLLLSALPLAATAAGGTTLYNWTASTPDKDDKVFSSNLLTGEEKVRWNETAQVYTENGKVQMPLHTFVNKVIGRGTKVYGLPKDAVKGTTDSLRVDAFPTIDTAGLKAIDLSFVYAYKPGEKGLNVANSDLLRVYVSTNGMDWTERYVGIRSAEIIGTGTTQSGEAVICYEIHTEDLMKIAGEYICGIRIMPDGMSGVAKGTFSLSEITVTGYKSKADFESAVPAQSMGQADGGKIDIEDARKLLLETARNSTATTELERIVDAFSLATQATPSSLEEMLNSTNIRPVEGISTAAAESVHMLFTYMLERHLMTEEKADQLLTEYEAVKTTADIVTDLNTPQQILRAYGKSAAGDILLQVTEKVSHAYMVVESDPVYLPDRINVDPVQSTITYLTMKGEVTKTFFDAYIYEGFLPLTLDILATGTAKAADVDVFASMVDGVQVAVTSSQGIRSCEIAVGGQKVVPDNPAATGLVCTDKALADAVAALSDGKHEMTVTVASGLGEPQTIVVEFEKKDGKAAVLGTVAPDHSATCRSKAMTDVDKNAWYHEAVDYALAGGIMSGYNATTFGPNDTLSRAMVVQVLYNKEGQPAISGKHDFTDVPADQWFNNAVTWGTQNGVMGGYGDGKFGPNDSVTIEQIAVILWNYSGNPAFSGKADSVGAYSGWAANALAWAVENDILAGVPFTNATENATRAQTAQMLMNYLKNN